MGIMKKTPSCLSFPVQSNKVKNIIHIELDDRHPVKMTPKEKVIWKTDFVKFVSKRKKENIHYDGVVIWHGPEHLTKKDGLNCIKDAVSISKRWMLIGCPWDRLEGWKHQPRGKEHLGHKSVWVENDFLKLGFRVISFGPRKKHPGHLIAWRIKNE